MRPATSTPFRLAYLLGALPLAAALLGCGSGGGGTGDPGQARTSTFDVRVLEGRNLSALSMDLRHLASFDLVDVVALGPLAGATCAENAGATRLQVACIPAAPIDAPLSAWRLTFTHPGSESLSEGVTSLTCQGSAGAGTLVLDCEVVAP